MLQLDKQEVYAALTAAATAMTAKQISFAIFGEEEIARAMQPRVRLLLNQGTQGSYVIRDNSRIPVVYRAGPALTADAQ